MNAKFIAAIAIAVLIIIFALQNTVSVDLQFFAWDFSGSLSLFLLLSIIFGVAIGSLFTISLRKVHKKDKHAKGESAPTSENPVVKHP
jgi:lipopolysaccharide assembly protein A